MIYVDFKGKKLSSLGLGCMRFPTVGGQNGKIDYDQTAKMVDWAIKNGINYFDTAYMYHDGTSEETIGKILSAYERSSFYLADKFPGFSEDVMNRKEEIFESQLRRCGVEYFDFYLFHNLCESNLEWYLDEQYGLFDFLIEQKRKGRIKHLGFSTHGTLDTMKRFLDAYGKDMEFCQIQLNWLDWEFQNAKAKVELLGKWNIPVWVMEPVRGGRIIKLEDKYIQRLKAVDENRTTAEWAFRFIQGVPGVGVTLSGMSNMSQLEENVRTFSVTKPLCEDEKSLLIEIGKEMTGVNTVPCTACSYCTEKCPIGLNIPYLIETYNEHLYSEGGVIPQDAISDLEDDKTPSACIGCKGCESVCPQNIKISSVMEDFVKRMK